MVHKQSPPSPDLCELASFNTDQTNQTIESLLRNVTLQNNRRQSEHFNACSRRLTIKMPY